MTKEQIDAMRRRALSVINGFSTPKEQNARDVLALINELENAREQPDWLRALFNGL